MVQGFVNVNVLRFLLAVIRSVRRDANPFRRTIRSSFNFPAVLRKADVNLVPKASVPYLISFVKIVYVKAANVGSNFSGAMIAPMVFDIPNSVAMRTRVAFVIAKILKLSLIKIVNKTNKTKKLWLRGLV